MAQNERNDLKKLLGNKDALAQLASSPDAQALASLLTKGHEREKLEQMAHSAASGNTQSLKELMNTITGDPESMELLRRLSEQFRNN